MAVTHGVRIDAEDLELAYGSALVFTRSSFQIPPGRLTAVIGPNGSGKSTLLNAIAGLLRPRAGELRVAARDGVAARIAYVLQSTSVSPALPITVREVVTMGRYASTGVLRPLSPSDRAAVAAAMERVGIADLAGRPLHQLSGGQRQRVQLAQALAQEHDVLLLDEPLAGIDLPTARALDAIVHGERSHGCTVVTTTHDLTEARMADHVLLVGGRIVCEGKPETVLTSENLTTAYGPAAIHADARPLFLDDASHHEHAH